MFYELDTPRLHLRPLVSKDLNTVHEYASDVENTRYMCRLPNRSINETYAFLRDAEAEWQKAAPMYHEFAVELDGRQIGAVSVYIEDNEGELGWIFNRKYWNQGYATEAAMALKEFAVNVLGLRRLCAHCDTRNTASAHVMEKLGMVLESEGPRTYRDERGEAREYRYVWKAC